jgi:hypothetical protein
VDPRIEHLERLRKWRGGKDRDADVSKSFREFAREQTKLSKALGTVSESFEAIVPLVIANECTLVGLRSGLLTVETRSASCRYALDRFLRSGGEAALRDASQRTAQPILRVRVVCQHD